MPSVRTSGFVAALLVAATVGACKGNQAEVVDNTPVNNHTAGTGDPNDPTFDPLAPDTGADRFREMMIVAPSVVRDARTSSETGGPWSFRWLVEELTPTSTTPQDLVRSWLLSYSGTEVSGAKVTPRPDVRSKLVCPWLRQSPENGCNEDCSTCSFERFDLAKAPFKLMAIVNRTDIPTGPCKPGAEGRFVFGAVDPATGKPLEMTVIFEYSLPGTAMEWARDFHELSRIPFGPEYRAKLEVLTRGFAGRRNGLMPELAHLRTAERAFGAEWELREFVPSAQGVSPVPPSHTPRFSVDNTSELAAHIKSHTAEILAGDNVLRDIPAAGAATVPSESFRWMAENKADPVMRAFSRNTCNGCHGGEHPADDPVQFRHVALAPNGDVLLSRFLNDPNGNPDELGRRQQIITRLIRARTCNDETGGGYSKAGAGNLPGSGVSTPAAALANRASVVH